MSEPFAAVDVIIAKRERLELSDAQIDWVLDAYTRGVVADEQMSALAMAILLNGMTAREIARWTAAMIASGERMDFSGLGRPTADKHSTGGVGDKITLPLAPLVAACGVAVPQLSGRGLGHTGGTLDKLESIPGWRARLSTEEMLAVLRDVGAVVCAAGDGLAPADRKLYALRDVTGTVEAIPLIASSIMSKKIAEGTGALVLDVKVGSGAFMKDVGRARELAATMVGLGTAAGVRTVALLTAMDTPLGLTAGNALEVAESVEVLAGGGPAGRRRSHGPAGRGDARRRGGDRAGPGPPAGRRVGDGRLAPDDHRPGRRPRRPAADRQGGLGGHRAGVRGAHPARRLRRWASRPGGWVPGGPARRTRSRPGREWSCTPSRGTAWSRAGRCSPSSRTSRSGSSGPSRPWPAPTPWTGTTHRRCRWSSTGSTRPGPDPGRRSTGWGQALRLVAEAARLNGSLVGGEASSARGQLSRDSPTHESASSHNDSTLQPRPRP